MPKDRHLSVRITQAEHDALLELARRDRRQLSDYVRILITDHIQEKGKNNECN